MLVCAGALQQRRHLPADQRADDQGRKLLSCGHCQELSQPDFLASDWLFTPIAANQEPD